MQSKEVYKRFNIAGEIREGKYEDFLKGKSVILFFPASSVRTQVTFEKEKEFASNTASNYNLVYNARIELW